MAKVSVIIPAYNVEAYIRKTVQSCLNQTISDIEIITVDDGSKDNSGNILDELANEHSNIRVIHKANGGVTAARKDGIKLATGKYIFLLDGDDYLEKDALEVMYKAAEKENADYVVGDFLIDFGTHKTERKFQDFGVVNNIDFLKYIFRQGDFYYTGRLYRKSFYDQVNFDVPTDITFGEDNLAVEQLAFNVSKAVKVNRFVLNYVQRIESVTNRRSRNDLDKRAKACNLLISLVEEQGIYGQIEDELTLWALREIEACIRRGYVDKQFTKRFLSIGNVLSHISLNKSTICILLSACVSMSATIKLIKLIRRYR